MTPSRRNYNQNWLPSIFNDLNWLPSIFNDFFDNDWMVRSNATAPAINVTESDKDYKVEVAAPGMTKDDFNIQLGDDNELIITMEKKNETKEEDKQNRKYLRREFSSRPRKRTSRTASICAASSLTRSSSRAWFCRTTWRRNASAPTSWTVC